MGHPEPTGWAELIGSKPERNARLPPTASPAPPPPPPEQQDSINPTLTNPITQKRVRPGSPSPAISPSKKSKSATLPPCIELTEKYFATMTPVEQARIVDGSLTELQKSQGMLSSLTQPCEAICTLQSQNTEVVDVVDVSSDDEDEMPAENDDGEDATTIKTCSCQNNLEATKCGNCHVTDVNLSNGHILRDIPNNWVLVTTSEKSKCDNERAIADAIGVNMKKQKRNNPTTVKKMLFGAFAASQPGVPTSTQETLSAASRHAFFLEV
jgi:hypothetical protein